MQRFKRFMAILAVALTGVAVAQNSEQTGGEITAITVEEGSITEFLTADPEGTCEERLNELEANGDEDDDVLKTGLDGYVCLREALQTTGVADTFDGNGSITLLAPTDEAFADYIEEQGMTAAAFMADTEMLSEILRFHILTEGRSLAELIESEETSFTTALGPEVDFFTGVAGGGAVEDLDEIGFGPNIEGEAEVAGNTVAFSDSYLIPIDEVLLPPAE